MRTIAAVLSAALAMALNSALGADGSWGVDADGNWNLADPSPWVAGIVADGVGSTANFTLDITASRTVTLTQPRTIGNLNLSDGGVSGSTWFLAGVDVLTLAVASGTPTITAQTIVRINTVIAGNQGLVLRGSNANFTLGAANTYSGTTTIGAPTEFTSYYFTASIPDGANSQFGNSTTAVQLISGGIMANALSAVVGRDIDIAPSGVSAPYLRNLANGDFSGDIVLGRTIIFDANPFGGSFSTLSGTLFGSGGVDFIDGADTGNSTLYVTGNNSYSGTTTVGHYLRLLIDGTTSGQGNYVVNNFAGGTLGGTGTIGLAAGRTVTVNASGILAPGDSIGTLTVSGGNVIFNGSSVLASQVAANGSGDRLTIAGGALDLSSGTAVLRITGALAVGDYVLASATGGRTGTFGSVYFNGVLVADPTTPGAIEGTHHVAYTGTEILLTAPTCNCSAATTAALDAICAAVQSLPTTYAEFNGLVDAAIDAALTANGCDLDDPCRADILAAIAP